MNSTGQRKGKCRFDKQCNNASCTNQHTIGKCPGWDGCSSFHCSLRHGRDRKGPCREGACCSMMATCLFLHPSSEETGATVSSASANQAPTPSFRTAEISFTHPRNCKSGATCFAQNCTYVHPVEQCPRWQECTVFFCDLRHAKDRWRPCKAAATCFNDGCTYLHPVEKCPRWTDCNDFTCALRHGRERPAKCKARNVCNQSECRFLHPSPICNDENCFRGLCLKRHTLAPTHPLRVQAKKEFRKIFDLYKAARKKHLKKLSTVVKRAHGLEGTPPVDSEEVEQQKQVMQTIFRQGLELQRQLDFFDECFADEYQHLIQQSETTLKERRKFYFRCRRECLRLTLALPALSLRKQVLQSLNQSQFVVVKGETGSGKSTQLPQYILEMLMHTTATAGRCRVICTQPRKVSAVSLAERVAQEWSGDLTRSTKVGGVVGYRVGGSSSKISRNTCIEYTTEGTLLQTLIKALKYKAAAGDGDGVPYDPLRSVGAIIIDEAHERSTLCDILLGLLKKEAPQRWPQLKVIVTSATLDTDLFVGYFHACPLVCIPGRMFPVDIVHRPLPKGGPLGTKTDGMEVIQASVDLAMRLLEDDHGVGGDILSFLTGQDDVERAKELLERKLTHARRKDAKVFVLYGRQPPEDQQLVFQPFQDGRKVIFATDVAETGLTIDGVRHVIDSGLSKEARFDPRRNVTVLEVDSICQSSAQQRCGRAGRTAPGTCYRLYNHDDWLRMDPSPQPEVLVRPLELTVVTLISMGITRPEEFNWMQPPDTSALAAAMDTLSLLQGIQRDEAAECYQLTELGQLMADLQADPSLVRIIYRGCELGMGLAACTLAGVLSVASTFFWRGGNDEAKKAADALHRQFASPQGDVVSMMKAFGEWMEHIESLMGPEAQQAMTTATIGSVTAAAVADEEDHDEEDTAFGGDEDTCADDDGPAGDGKWGRDWLPTVASTQFTGESPNDSYIVADADADSDDASEHTALSSVGPDASLLLGDDDTIGDFEDDASLSLEETNVAATREAEERMRRCTRLASSKKSRQWCTSRSLNSKSLLMALAAREDFVRSLKRFHDGKLWQARPQDLEPTAEQWQRLVWEGYFHNVSHRLKDSPSYMVLRHEQTQVAKIHPSSSLSKLTKDATAGVSGAETAGFSLPAMVVFASLLSSSRTFMMCVTTVRGEWLNDVPPAFRTRVEQKVQHIHNKRVVLGHVPPNLGAKIMGKGGRGRRALEELLQCSLAYDEKAMELEAWVNEMHMDTVRQTLEEKVAGLRAQAMHTREEVMVDGRTRAVIKAGYEVEYLLAEDEFVSINVLQLPGDATQEAFEAFLQSRAIWNEVINVEWVVAGDAHRGAFAVVHFKSPQAAKIGLDALRGEVFGGHVLTVEGTKLTVPPQPVMFGAKATLSWPMGVSEGTATLFFGSDQAAENLLRCASEFVRQLNAAQTPQGCMVVSIAIESKKVTNKPTMVILHHLQPTVDEIALRQFLLQFLTNQRAPSDYFPTGLSVQRVITSRDLSDDALTVQLALIRALLPLKESLLGCTSFFETKPGGRGGLLLEYDNVETLERAQQHWIEACRNRSLWTEDSQLDGFAFGHDLQDVNTPLVMWNRLPVRFHVYFTATVLVHQALWESIEAQLRRLLDELKKAAHQELKVKTQPAKGNAAVPRVVVYLKSTKLSVVRTAHAQVTALLEPLVVSLTRADKAFVFTPAGSRFLQKMATELRSKAVFIHWNNRRQQVFVYGPNDTVRQQSAVNIVTAVAQTVASSKKRTFYVKNKKTFLTSWKTAAVARKTLYSWCAGRGKRAEVTVTALPEILNEVENWAKSVGIWLADNGPPRDALGGVGLGEGCTGCLLCFAPPNEVDQPFFYAACAHGGCQECVVSQFAAMEGGDVTLPVLCSGETCRAASVPLALDDILVLAPSQALANMRDRAVDDYVAAHREELMYCPMPGCNTVLRIATRRIASSEEEESQCGGYTTIHCPECTVSYCLSCTDVLAKVTPVHDGLSCASKRLTDDNKVNGVVREVCDRLLSFHCPHCDRVVFDFSGCCAVTCECGGYFCGLCHSGHKDSSTCHEHVKTCFLNPNKGCYFVSETNLAEVYKQRRIRAVRERLDALDRTVRELVLVPLDRYLRDVGFSKNDVC